MEENKQTDGQQSQDMNDGEAVREPGVDQDAASDLEGLELDDEAFKGTDLESSEDDIVEGEEQLPSERLLSLHFNINVEELFHFQLIMNEKQLKKNKKRSTMISIVEIVISILYIVTMLIAGNGTTGQFLISVALTGFGVYGLLYYRYFFLNSLRKKTANQHRKVPYLQSEIRLDIYNNKCVECWGDQKNEVLWKNIYGVREVPDAFYLLMEEKRGLLLPKRRLADQEARTREVLKEMCALYGKQWDESSNYF